jgi:spore coat polysaccharide biosynthesis predicted glycosyltransferase SpsG
VKPVIALHVDGGRGVGLGHAARGLGLAAALQARRCDSVFAVSDGATGDYLRRMGQRVVTCEATAAGLRKVCVGVRARGLVIDSYHVAAHVLARLSDGGLPLVCFDDTGERDVPSDLLVNGSPAAMSLPYRERPGRRLLLGPAYQVVRSEFVPDVTRDLTGPVKAVLLTVGGDDPLGVVGELLPGLASGWLASSPGARLDVVIGPFTSGPSWRDVPAGVRVHQALADLRTLMIEADLAVSAGGQTLYELFRCGTPTVGICVAADQAPNLEALARLGAVEHAGWARPPGWLERVTSLVRALAADHTRRERLAGVASALIDGLGAARIADEIVAILRPAVAGHPPVRSG